MNKETYSDYYLERYILGELSEEDTREIRRQASTNPEVLAALENIESSNQAVLLRYPPTVVKERLLGRLAEARGRKNEKGWLIRTTQLRRLLYVSSAFAAALILLVLVRPSLKKEGVREPARAGEEYSQAKGTEALDLSKTQLLVYRKNKDRVEMLSDGSLSRAGDLCSWPTWPPRLRMGSSCRLTEGAGLPCIIQLKRAAPRILHRTRGFRFPMPSSSTTRPGSSAFSFSPRNLPSTRQESWR